MVSSRFYLPPSFKDRWSTLRARYYPAVATRALQVMVGIRMDAMLNHPRMPAVDSIFSGYQMQPYIHDCIVTLTQGHHKDIFRVYFKRHCRLPHNQSAGRINTSTPWLGDMLVMRVCTKDQGSLVHMRGGDGVLADHIVSKLTGMLRNKRRGALPRALKWENFAPGTRRSLRWCDSRFK